MQLDAMQRRDFLTSTAAAAANAQKKTLRDFPVGTRGCWEHAASGEFLFFPGHRWHAVDHAAGPTLALAGQCLAGLDGVLGHVGRWRGLAKAGVTAALLNTNLVGNPLAHAVRTAVAGSAGGL